MNNDIDEFFLRPSNETPQGGFHKVIPLHANVNISWNEVLEIVPAIPKGWYELSRISQKDRLEFTFDHWISTLPYHPKLEKCLETFFNSIEQIGIYLIQQKLNDPFEAQIVYSLKDSGGFYRGGLPSNEASIATLQQAFSTYILPSDYLAFLQIHDGFWKTTDSTGLIKSCNLKAQYLQFQNLLAQEPSISTTRGDPVNPKSLIPFYESFGMPYFQCFWGEWYPEQEMGNVYYSGDTKTISCTKGDESASETLGFPTFSDWLAFYLERVI